MYSSEAFFSSMEQQQQLPSPQKRARTESFSNGAYSLERESNATKSKACLKFFSTSGCSYGEGCHFSHYVPGGVASLGLPHLSNMNGNGANNTKRDSPYQTGLPMSQNFSRDQGSAPSGYKTRLCKNYESEEGCQFGEKCHFAHGERELRKHHGPRDSAPSYMNKYHMTSGHEDNPRVYHEPAAAASFGAVSTAKVTIDASLAGVIIGKGGVNAKSISRATGAKLYIRDHESDSNLKNVEMEGSFDQIKSASAMVRDLLAHKDVAGSTNTRSYKPKLCENFPKGTCSYGDRCYFAHSQGDLHESASVV